MKIKINGVPGAGDKLNIGPDGKMEATPEMLEMLGISMEDIESGESDGKPKLQYEEVSISEIDTRTITDEEYDVLPSTSKSGLSILLRPKLFFIVAVMAVIVYFVFKFTTPEVGYIPYIVLGAMVIFVTLGVIITTKRGVSANSEVASGTVMFMNTYRSANDSSDMRYHITVAFPDQKKFVKNLKCDFYTYSRVKMNSKVYVVNGRVYAAE